MHQSKELDYIRKQISSEHRKSPQILQSDKLPLVHSRSTSQNANLNEVLSRDISHRLDTSQKPKTSFENMEMQLRGILGIKQESCKLPTDFEELESFLKRSLEVREKERLVQELERMNVNVREQKEKFLGKVVKEGGLLYRTQSGLLQPQMCRLYEQIVGKGKGKKGRGEGGEFKKGDMELGVPSGRKEVEILIAWLENMSSVYLEEDGIGMDEKVRRAQIIYTACFKEVVRQVSVQCIERGVLIQRIWNASVDLSSLKEDVRVQQMQELQQKVQSITDTTISDLKSRCEKAEKNITELKRIIQDKDDELFLVKKEEVPNTPEFKVQYVPFERSAQQTKFKSNSKMEKKSSFKSSIEDSVQEINEVSVSLNQPLVLFGYIDDSGVFHKQKIIHKNEEGVHLNNYFDDVVEIAKSNSIGTSPKHFEVENKVVEEVKEHIEVFYVKVEQKFTQFPELRIPLQISKQFNSRVLIKPIKSSSKDLLEIKNPRTKRLKSVEMNPQGVSEEEFSESFSELEEKKNEKIVEKVVKTKGKGKIGMKKNMKFRTIKKKNEIKINVNDLDEKKGEENFFEGNEELRAKSKSQFGEGMGSSEGFNRKGRLSEYYQGNLKKPKDLVKSPGKISDQAESLGKSSKATKNLGMTSRSNLRTQKVEKIKGNKGSESENSVEENIYRFNDPVLVPTKKSISPEKNIPKYGKSNMKTEKSPIKLEKTQVKSKASTETLKKAEKKAIKIDTNYKPDHYYTFEPEEIPKILENPKKKKSSVKLQEEPSSPDKQPRKLQKLDPDIKKNQIKAQSPLKATNSKPISIQPQEKTSKQPNPNPESEASPILKLDKSCQVQIDPIPSEDLTRAQVLSSIQELKKTLVDYKQDKNKHNKLLKDTRAFKRASKLSNILNTLFNIPEPKPNTLNTLFEKSQLENLIEESKNVNSAELNFKEKSFENSENDGFNIKGKKTEKNVGNKALQRSITLFDEFTLGIVNRKIIVSHPGQKMLGLVLQSIDSFASIRPTMSAKSLIKMINAVYSEKISILKEQVGFKGSDVSMVLYEFVINMYGLKTVAENKFKQIIISTIAYRDQYPRINNFSKFLNLNSSYTPEDWNFYLSLFEILDYHNFGLNLSNEVNHYSSLQTINFCIRQHLENRLKNEVIEEIISASYGLQETQPETSINKRKGIKGDLVNTDKLLELLLSYYYKFKGKICERLEINVPREEFLNFKQFFDTLQKLSKKEGIEKIFEAHCLNKKDELGELSKVIRVESVLSVIFDNGFIEL